VQFESLGGMRLAFEIDGGGERGRHQKHLGYIEDCRKLNLALLLGWAVFRFTPTQLAEGEHIKVLATVCMKLAHQ
jgi:hypothetical protein